MSKGHKTRQNNSQMEGHGTPYWRGNPSVSPTRKDLLKCNISNKDDWNTCLYTLVNIYFFLKKIYSQILIILTF